jgi:hypothetical protein
VRRDYYLASNLVTTDASGNVASAALVPEVRHWDAA